MDIEKSFKYPFDDRDWVGKLGLGAVIGIVPILNFAWYGYMVEIIRNVMDDVLQPLPTWDDLGKKFSDGLILFAASFIYTLPITILLCLPLGIMAFSGVLSGSGDMDDIAQVVAGAGGILFTCFLCVFFLYGMAFSILYPAILVLFAREGTFASCFKVREALDLISRNAGPFFTAWGLSLLVNFGVSTISGLVSALVSWIPCLGLIVSLALALIAGVYSLSVYAHLFGQFSKEVFGKNQPIIVG